MTMVKLGQVIGRPVWRGLWVAFVSLFLVACASPDMSDLETQVEEILQRPPGKIKPLPEIRPYRPYVYQSGTAGARDPYTVFFLRVSGEFNGAGAEDGLSEALRREMKERNLEELERFDLDSLQMLGYMENDEGLWGIVGDPEGVVHRVAIGNYIGKNFGKIVEVSETQIVLREIVKNASNGRWENREAQLVLLD